MNLPGLRRPVTIEAAAAATVAGIDASTLPLGSPNVVRKDKALARSSLTD